MSTIWNYISIGILIILSINTFCLGYYGNKTAENIIQRIGSGTINLVILLVVYGGVVAIIYFFAGTLKFTFTLETTLPSQLKLSELAVVWTPIVATYSRTYSTTTAFLLCLITPLVLVGSITFGVFAGAGMAIFPLELIFSYFNQPTKPNAEEYVLSKRILLQSSERIIAKIRETYDIRRDLDINPITNPVEKKMKLKILNEKANEMKNELQEYEEVFLVFKQQDNILDNNPLVYLGYLIIGVLFFLISILFVVHTFLSLKGYYVLLDGVFNYLAGVGSLLALIVFIFISIFVGLSILKASIKLSGLLGSILGILPFKLNATWTDTFLTNNQILLYSLIGMIMYFVTFMPIFLRFMTSVVIFSQVIAHVSFVNAIFTYSIPEYIYMLFFLIGVVILLFAKSPKAILDEKIKEEQVKLESEKERLKEMESGKDDKKEPEKK